MTAGEAAARRLGPGTIIRILTDFLATAAGAAAMVFLFYGFYGDGLLFLWLIVPACSFAAVFVHELGHAIAARVVGWRIVVFAVWPCALRLTNPALVISANVSAKDGGGYVYVVPGYPRANTRLRYAIICAAGPLFSLAAGSVLLAVALLVPVTWFQPLWAYDGPHRQFFGLAVGAGLINMTGVLLTAIPYVSKSSSTSDAKKVVDTLARSDPNAMSIVHSINGMLYYRVRQREIPHWMHEAAREEGRKATSLPPVYDRWDISRLLDANHVDVAKARERIDRYKQTYGADEWISAYDAFVAASYEDDPVLAVAALERLTGKEGEPEMTLVALASAAARKGDLAAVTSKFEEMDSYLDLSPFPNRSIAAKRKQIWAIAKSAADAASQHDASKAGLSPAT